MDSCSSASTIYLHTSTRENCLISTQIEIRGNTGLETHRSLVDFHPVLFPFLGSAFLSPEVQVNLDMVNTVNDKVQEKNCGLKDVIIFKGKQTLQLHIEI